MLEKNGKLQNGKLQLEFSERHRPKTLEEMVGQPDAVKVLKKFLDHGNLPHTIMFVGPSGVGKTTLSRILASYLGCEGTDYVEIDCAIVDPLDTMRSLKSRLYTTALNGSYRIYLFDEFQTLSRAKFSQQSILKMLEDVPPHVYFFIATTNPSKIIPTIHTRCTRIDLFPVDADSMRKRLLSIASREKTKISEDVLDKIIESSGGSVRLAEKNLEKVLNIDDEDQQLAVIGNVDTNDIAWKLVKTMIWDRSATFRKVASMIAKIETDDWESMRRWVLSCACGELLKANKGAERAYQIILAYEVTGGYFDTGKPGRASFVRAAYEVMRK